MTARVETRWRYRLGSLARAARTNARLLAVRILVSAAFYAVIPFSALALAPLFDIEIARSVGIVALAVLCGRMLSWPIGALVDRAGAERVLLAAIVASAAIGSWTLAAPSTASAGLFLLTLAAVNPIANIVLRVLVSRRNPPRRRTEAFGLLGSAKTIGIAAGPAFTGLFVSPDDWTGLAGTAVVVLVVAGLATTIARPSRRSGNVGGVAQAVAAERGEPLPSGVLPLIGAAWALVWTGLNAITVGLAPLFALRYEHVGAVATFFVAQSLLSALLLIVAGMVLARADQKTKAIAFGCAATGVPFALLAFGLAPIEAAIAVALAVALVVAASEAVTVPALDSIVAATAPSALGGAFGRLATIETVGVVAGLGLASLLAIEHEAWDVGGNWVLAGAIMLVVASALAAAIVARASGAASGLARAGGSAA